MAEKSLTVRPGSWSEDAEVLLARSAHDPLVGVATLRGMVEAGRGVLFEVLDGAELVSAYVLQANHCEHGKEIVVVAAGANLRGYSLTRHMVPYIEQQSMGYDRLRIAASRPGMCRQLEKMNFSRQSTTYVKNLHVF